MFENVTDSVIKEQMNMHAAILMGETRPVPKDRHMPEAKQNKWKHAMTPINGMAFLGAFRQAQKRGMVVSEAHQALFDLIMKEK